MSDIIKYPDDLSDITNIPKSTILRDWFKEGVRVIVVRANFSMNVYLGVPIDHQLAGFDYDDIPLDCHGGLTYGRAGDDKYLPKDFYGYGYDYSHLGDYAWYDHDIESFRPNTDKKWTLGEIVDDAWQPIYGMQKLIKIAEKIAGKK